MKKIFILAFSLVIGLPAFTQLTRTGVDEKIDTTQLDYQELAEKITASETGNFKKATTLLLWLTNRLQWMATDYKSRTVNEIIARGGGNCFELAKVYMKLVSALRIEFRPIAEINIHQYSDGRQATAEEKVKQSGNRMSVFGRQHNDHRWVEVYDDENKKWEPVDPSMSVIGTDQWLKARVGFGERITLDTAITNQIIVPFAIFVTENSKMTMHESRSEYYLLEGFNKLYNNQLIGLSSWSKWVSGVTDLQKHAKDAFEGSYNLHNYSQLINDLEKTYQRLKKEFLDSK